MSVRNKFGGAVAGGAVLASLALAGVVQGQVKVAVVYGGQASGLDCRDQLNDDTFFDFDAVAIGASQADSLAELQQYHCVVLGDAGFRDNGYTAQMFAAMREYMDAGGGIVTVGWYNYCTDFYTGQQAADADYITPIADGPYDFLSNPGSVDVVSGHPITDGISDFNFSARFHEYETAIDANATSLGSLVGVSGSAAMAYQDENGRSCYLGGLYLANDGSYNTGGLRSGVEDQLLEQAVAWAGGGGGTCLEMVVSALVAGQQANWDVTGADPNTRVAIVYGFQPGTTVVNGTQGYCATFGIKGVNPGKLVCQKLSDANGELRCSARVPANAQGQRVLSQAAMQGTCPNECMSNLDDQVVG